ncbi:Flp family type IVb pilin [Kordiimonas aestuarii]|uniref:Flp family type IVb pilin n=1 Tax=Kordiimonas aestuarii TaxID=1005925 RepID=UPI0021D2D8B1|nr:Flp family type IVb pilin [Kordiimonas aestuarii]
MKGTIRQLTRQRYPAALGQLIRNIDGATAVEYCLIGALIAAGLSAGIGTLSDVVLDIFEMLGTEVDIAGDGS